MNQSCLLHRSKSLLKKSCLSVLVAAALSANVSAQKHTDAVQYAISSGDLVQAVNEISRNSGVQIIYDIELLRGLKAGEVKGSMTLEQALDRVLNGTGLDWARVNATTVSIKKKPTSKKRATREKRAVASDASPQAGPQQDVEDLDSVVVVGSRLGGSPVESAMPIKLITREQIDRSGAGNIAQALSSLSEVSVNNNGDLDIGGTAVFGDGGNVNSTTVQMRGLPRGTTLVLINGRRAGQSSSFTSTGQFDLSSIPLSLVDRIEVLPAGSSAVYGGDGLAGVVNVVLRKDANGAEMRLRKAHADGYNTDQFGLMWGKSWGNADLAISASWQDSGALYSDERSLTADQDFRRFGGADRRSTLGNPATIYSLDGCPPRPAICRVNISTRGYLPGLNSTIAVVPENQNGQNLKPEDFLGTQGTVNRISSRRHLRSAEKVKSLGVNARVNIFPTLEAFSELTYTDRDIPAYQVPLLIRSGRFALTGSVVSASNPFNPFGVDVGVDYAFDDAGVFTSYSQRYMRGLAGLRANHGNIEWEISGWLSRDRTRSGGGSAFDTTSIAAALSSSDPQKALNPFVGDGSSPASKDVLESLLKPLTHESKSINQGITAYIKGNVAELPAGDLTVLGGFEWQRQGVKTDSNSTDLLFPFLTGDSTSRAVFSEFRLPLMSASGNVSRDRMAVTGAIRRETSDRYDAHATTHTYGLEFWSTESLLLRSTHSTAFRPILTFFSVLNPFVLQQPVVDPKMNELEYMVGTTVLGGVPPELEPEKSKTTTLGLVYRPTSDWSLAFTYWNIQFRDRIASIGVQDIVNNEVNYPGRVHRDPQSGMIESIDARQVNISAMNASGADIDFDISWPVWGGSITSYVTATYTNKYEEKATDQSPLVNGVARHNNSGWAPRWKIVPRVVWDFRDVAQATIVGRYVSSYRDSVALTSGDGVGKYRKLGDFWTFDFNIGIPMSSFGESPLMANSHLSVGVTNLLNRLPDFCAGCHSTGYDASQYDIVGRTIYAEFRASF